MPTISRATAVGWLVVLVSAVLYWLAARDFDAGRGDFFYLADAFLHGRTWLDFRPGAIRRDHLGGRFYVPFAPFPAIALMPVVAVLGAVGADQVESGINAAPGRGGRRAVLDAPRPARRARAPRSVRADRPVRLLHADPVGDHPRWRLAHRPAHRDDPDVHLPHRAVGPAPGVAHRPGGRRGLPDPRAARVRGAVLRLAARRTCGRPDLVAPALADPVADLGRGSPSASCRRSSASSSTTRSGSGRRSSPATRSRRCRASSRSSASRASSPSPTSP